MSLVRNELDGQLGTVVHNDEGKPMVRLDRGKQEILVPYLPSLWKPAERPKLSPMQVARVCYEADRAYRLARGEYGVAEWISLKQEKQREWLLPPSKGDDRAKLYAAIRAVLG